MRRDVRLGFAIGGVLLAVVIVYVLVVPGDNDARPQISENDVTVAPLPDAAGPPDGAPVDASAPTANQPPAPDRAADPFSPAKPPADNTEVATGAPGGNEQWNWDLLDTEQVPPAMMTQTPGGAAKTSDPAPAQTPGSDTASPSANGSYAPNDTMTDGATGIGNAPANTRGTDAPTTRPMTGARTHTVEQGETFSSISDQAYGSPNYYPHIMRANPGVDPSRLKVGTIINLPALEDVKPGDSTPARADAVVSDSKTEYRVQPGDSLYAISMKLYGRPDRVDKLYSLNRDAIGPDPERLKVGMVLKLPEAPNVTASR